jgi:hypothetical protein
MQQKNLEVKLNTDEWMNSINKPDLPDHRHIAILQVFGQLLNKFNRQSGTLKFAHVERMHAYSKHQLQKWS